MINDLFINSCILISFVYMTVELMQNGNIKRLSLYGKSLISGLAFSASSILLIKFSTYVTPTVYLDFRSISQSASAFYGGPISSILTGLISSLFRVFYYGINENSVLTFLAMMSSAIVCAFISKKDLSKNVKWILMIISSNFIHAILFIIILSDITDILSVIFCLTFGTLFIASIIYYVFDHLDIAHQQIEKLKQQASIDFLTGVNNKGSFNFLYEQSTKKATENNEVFSVLMIDIDFFKKINDRYGHLAGDKVLKDLGSILKILFKENAIIGRVGGEEFCILLEGYSNKQAL